MCVYRMAKKKKKKKIELRTREIETSYVLSWSSRPPIRSPFVYKYIFMVPYVLCAREQDFPCSRAHLDFIIERET